MRKILGKIWKFVKIAGCAAAAFALVSSWPPVAIGFAGVYAAKHVGSEYGKIIVGTAAAALFAILMMNFAEIAVLVTLLPVLDFVNDWEEHVAAAA